MITKIKLYYIVPFVAATLALTGCSMPEEPDSHSEQGQTMNESTTTESTSSTEEAPQWIGHMDQIEVGMSQSEIKDILGAPDDTTSSEMSLPDMDSEGNLTEKTVVTDMWTYGDMFDTADGDDVWMLSFTDGKLESKSRM